MQEKIIKIIPGLLFLFCVLNVLELFLIIEDMNKTENIENEIKNNLKVLQDNITLLNKYSEHKKIRIK